MKGENFKNALESEFTSVIKANLKNSGLFKKSVEKLSDGQQKGTYLSITVRIFYALFNLNALTKDRKSEQK